MDMYFLYFPEDKREYIPAFITLVIFMIGAVATMYFIYKKSKKDEKYFDNQFDENNEYLPSKQQDEDEEQK